MWNEVINDSRISNRRILMALGVSLLIHIALLSKTGLLSSTMPARNSSSLQITLATPVVAQPVPAEPEPLSVPVPEELPSPQLIAAPASNSNSPATPVPQSKPPESKPAAEAAEKSPSEPAKPTPQTEQPAGIPRQVPSGRAQEVEIDFEVTAGVGGKSLGAGRHHYVSADGGEHYALSVTQTSSQDGGGQDDRWKLEISGRISRHGLSPQIFQLQGGVPERLMALNEVPGDAAKGASQSRSGRMPDGILDRQSLLYQFMMSPPAEGGGKMWLTDGGKHALFNYRIEGYESLRMGAREAVRTLKLVLSSVESTELIELWLIPESYYLPAKMRHTDSAGVVTEQLAVSLRFK